jgi:hypothetical protein
MADPPPTPPRPTPPLGREPLPLGKDVLQNEALRRARTVRSGAMVMAALWEE